VQEELLPIITSRFYITLRDAQEALSKHTIAAMTAFLRIFLFTIHRIYFVPSN